MLVVSATPEADTREQIAEHPTRNRLLAGMLVLMILYTCALGAVLIVPVLLALLFSLVLAPAVRRQDFRECVGWLVEF